MAAIFRLALGYVALIAILTGLVSVWHDHLRWNFLGEVAQKFRYERQVEMPNGTVDLNDLLVGKSLYEGILLARDARFKCTTKADSTTCNRERGGIVQPCPESWSLVLQTEEETISSAMGTIRFQCS